MLQVKGWKRFQNYKKRRPPWIRLYRDILDNFEWVRLPLASKALAPCLWLLASESLEGTIPADITWLAFRLHCTEQEVVDGLIPLINSGFLECLQGASDMLASRKRDTLPETEERQRQRQRQRSEAEKVPSEPVVAGAPTAKLKKPGPDTWLTPYGNAWKSRWGVESEPPWAEMAREFKKAAQEPNAEGLGGIGGAELLRRWIRFLSGTERPEFCRPARFIQGLGQWAERPASRRPRNDEIVSGGLMDWYHEKGGPNAGVGADVHGRDGEVAPAVAGPVAEGSPNGAGEKGDP